MGRAKILDRPLQHVAPLTVEETAMLVYLAKRGYENPTVLAHFEEAPARNLRSLGLVEFDPNSLPRRWRITDKGQKLFWGNV